MTTATENQNMSKSRRTGKHTQSKNKKVSFNLKPDAEERFLAIHDMLNQSDLSYDPITKTEAFEFMIGITTRWLAEGFAESIKQAEQYKAQKQAQH